MLKKNKNKKTRKKAESEEKKKKVYVEEESKRGGGKKKKSLFNLFLLFIMECSKIMPKKKKKNEQIKVMGPPTKLSAIWFPESQRGLATGFAASMNIGGNAVGFVLGPLLVPRGENFGLLLYVTLLMVGVVFVMIWCYFPARPQVMPNKAAHKALLSFSRINNDDWLHAQSLNDDSVRRQPPPPPARQSKQGLLNQKLTTSDNMTAYHSLGSGSAPDMSLDSYSHDEPVFKRSSLKHHFQTFALEIKELITQVPALLLILAGGVLACANLLPHSSLLFPFFFLNM
ncbi:hypothetical protein RFI_18690 [Reticulomyxa filosa]|uniref:Major facilitator superfamily (MFS) profile domain-containing protein n=1 Tax=Reticulomyxa filosa TaxID=46433 RepID=X6MX31_RETFI|nr:hypothetical protein RFI_18690 [Reticulomyxa filosa]|eukprot:ETO18573.1 hypothetical protein RFI_18690 [Reticulomyxa filosa]